MRTLLLGLALTVLAAGCSRKKTEATAPELAASQQSAPASQAAAADAPIADASSIAQPSKEGLVSLCSDPNPYISNNAKHSLSSWEAEDYKAAVLGIGRLLAIKAWVISVNLLP